MANRTRWDGIMTQLLDDLNSIVDESTRRSSSFPKTPKKLSSDMESIIPNLEKIGIRITSERTSEARLVHIEKMMKNLSYPSQASSEKVSSINNSARNFGNFISSKGYPEERRE